MNYEVSFLIACTAIFYCVVLTQPKMLLHKPYSYLYKKFVVQAGQEEVAHPLFKILMYCEKCWGGQAALWVFLYNKWEEYLYDPISTLCIHIAFISVTVLQIIILKQLYDRYGS
jgi:hypothetical protein